MIQNDFTIHIRRAESGDEARLAHVQTESWKAAFAGIVPAELLAQCTSIERAEKMYARLLAEQQGNGYILELDGKPHCVAWWDTAREEDMPGAAELRCIHSLPENWRRGCGSRMMERVLADVKAAGYTKLLLWVFTDNVRAIRFYEAQGSPSAAESSPRSAQRRKCTSERCKAVLRHAPVAAQPRFFGLQAAERQVAALPKCRKMVF